MQMGDLQRVVTDTAAAIDRHVMSTMLEKHRLAAHCTAIKRYLLLGQVTFPVAALGGHSYMLCSAALGGPDEHVRRRLECTCLHELVAKWQHLA